MSVYPERTKLIKDSELKREYVPYFIQVRPTAVIAAAATATVVINVGPRDFVWTHLGWTSDPVGLPATGMPFRLGIRDVTASINFSNARFDLIPVTGTNPGTGDNNAFELPVKWNFAAQSSISIELENIGAIADTPTVVLVGYLA